MINKYQSKYYAKLLSQRSIGGGIDCIAQSLLNASVDINPHQIDAALFVFQSPLSKGVIIADEVGLGKTIEAGLVVCQYWATGKRHIIIVCPASLRKQWSYELIDKFGIKNEIIDTKNYNEYIRNGIDPFSLKQVLICSYNFASKRKEEISAAGFELAVLDEAHKLRNVYKKNSKLPHNIRDAFANVKKLLLTATPFQNSLMELYGLTTVIDENIFGTAKSFRAEYVNEANYTDLQQRLHPYYRRTLRKDVTEYIKYTKRLSFTQEFTATDTEQKLYEGISEFLRSDGLYSVPDRQKMLTTMIIRKILASSSCALIGTLTAIRERLLSLLSENENKQMSLLDIFTEDEIEDIDEDLLADEEVTEEKTTPIDIEKLKAEIGKIEDFIKLAGSIKDDTKAQALLVALSSAFSQMRSLGAAQKALIFTESTRTQRYLKEHLESHGYSGKIVLFNGSNSDPESNAIYEQWVADNTGTGRISGIKAADKRMAIVDCFRNDAQIMIATEAASEGLNLQFCSLIVNYDLPWNPQRIEQRIGRCHRYGQKSDVVVVNFVNTRNYADRRVYELLDSKFHLFNDVFGASDEVLGQTDNIDFDRRILEIYQECRTEEEINKGFEQLQLDMQEQIEDRMSDVQQKVQESFDIDVQEHLRIAKQETGAFLNRYEYIFWELTKYVLHDKAEFDDKEYSFTLKTITAGCRPQRYALFSKQGQGEPYRLSHPLAQYVINTALSEETHCGHIVFEEKGQGINVTLPEKLRGKSGYLILSEMDISTFEDEQHSLFTAYTKDGLFLTQEECERLFLLYGTLVSESPVPDEVKSKLKANSKQHIQSKLTEIDSRNLVYFREEEDRIFRWEHDMVGSLEHELDTIKRQIRETERHSHLAANMQEKLELTKKIDDLERQKRRKRNELADREDEIGAKRRRMIAELEAKMVRTVSSDDVFMIEWTIK